MTVSAGVPVGVELLRRCFSLNRNRKVIYQGSVLVLTFLAYTSYHMSRRPLAIVKNSLNRDCSQLTPPDDLVITPSNEDNWCDWPPFDGKNANKLLGVLDSAYVFAYAVCMFISGMIAERMDLRYYLSIGMVLSGIFTYLFGLAFYLDIHNYAFFLVVQILAGAVQCTGWPGVVACVGNWFGKERRGFIFGVWNAHLYAGNILGAYVAGYFVVQNWGLSFIVPAILVGSIGFLLYLFLVPYPEDVECEDKASHSNGTSEIKVERYQPSNVSAEDKNIISGITSHVKATENTYLAYDPNTLDSILPQKETYKKKEAITFLNALRIPGVLEFSMCLFFSKLVSYTFLFWLPRYLDHSTGIGSQKSAYFSIAFDVGGILGGVVAGIISDYSGASAITCVGFLGLATPFLFIYEAYGSSSMTTNIILQIVCGALVNGPYALITTAVSAELGTHSSLKENSKALSTVTAIIDGTGSIGAAIGPLLAGMISEISWSYVFYMMMMADLFALLTLLRPALRELQELCGSWNRSFSIRTFRRCTPCCHNDVYEQI